MRSPALTTEDPKANLFFLKDGRILESRAPVIQDKDDKEKMFVVIDEEKIYVKRVKKVSNAWAEEGFQPQPPKTGDEIVGGDRIASNEYLESGVRPGVFLVETDLGDMIWVDRQAYIGLWRPAA